MWKSLFLQSKKNSLCFIFIIDNFSANRIKSVKSNRIKSKRWVNLFYHIFTTVNQVWFAAIKFRVLSKKCPISWLYISSNKTNNTFSLIFTELFVKVNFSDNVCPKKGIFLARENELVAAKQTWFIYHVSSQTPFHIQ